MADDSAPSSTIPVKADGLPSATFSLTAREERVAAKTALNAKNLEALGLERLSELLIDPAAKRRLRPDLNTLFCQVADITTLLAKFGRPWHYAPGGRGVLRRVWAAALPAVARSA